VGSDKRRQGAVSRNTVHLPTLPHVFDGFTILHLSDLHADMSRLLDPDEALRRLETRLGPLHARAT
jgi:predicted MPP superfamily phosphohydrolase